MESIFLKTSICFGSLTWVAFLRWMVSKSWGRCKPQYQVKNKVFIVTGANSGIGLEICKHLFLKGAHVILACKNENSANQAINSIKKKAKYLTDVGQLTFIKCDLNCQNSIKNFVNEIESKNLDIFGLINNAGVYNPPFQLNKDGFELQFMVNHLGNVLLTELLLSNIIKASSEELESKIIFVNSSLYKRGVIEDNFFIPFKMNEKIYKQKNMYSNSKLANLLYARTLATKLSDLKLPIYVNIASPGIVLTNLSRHSSFRWIKLILFSPLFLFILRTPKQGCQTILECALANRSSSNGNFYRNCNKVKYDPIADNFSLCKYVFEKSIQALKIRK